jgi:hypothetical protein
MSRSAKKGKGAKPSPLSEDAWQAVKAARHLGLYLLVEASDGRGERWTWYAKQGGSRLVTYRPQSGRWRSGKKCGVADCWRDVLAAAKRLAL